MVYKTFLYRVKTYICKKIMTKAIAEIINLCEALSNKHGLCIIAALSEKKKYISEAKSVGKRLN